MSKILYVAYRDNPILTQHKEKIISICNNLNPDNISPSPSLLYHNNNLAYGISNPLSTVNMVGNDILLGKLFNKEENWREIKKDYPDGNYAIFRANESNLEVVSDIVGSRAIWYYKDEHLFIASTSQVAIINYLGNFQFEEEIIPWMLSTGSLGPSHCWDKRIKKVPTDGSIIIDRDKWTLELNSNIVEFIPSEISEKKQELLLKNALQETFGSINLDFKKWTITLSGGHDSRAILLLFNKIKNTPGEILQTITWGSKKAVSDKEGDAYIAKILAKKIGTNHKYYYTEISEEPIELIINRFLNNGEGRIDHITGYLDGFKIWKNIYEDGIEGIIRGDEVFGYNKIFSPLIVNNFMGLTLCSEFSNLKKYEYINSLRQEIPEHLMQKQHESLSTWRDRIFQLYRIPYIQSALADLKYPYIEQISPFLSKKIILLIRQVPDYLRTDKKLFKRVMTHLDSGIPFAKRDSNLNIRNVLQQQQIVQLIKEELTSEYARTIFPESFLIEIVKNLQTEKKDKNLNKKNLIQLIKNAIPIKYKKYLAQKKSTLLLDENTLGFRVFIICKMHKKLNT